LWRAKWASIGAIRATDASVLIVQHNTFVGAVETIYWANCHARCVSTVHTGYRDGFLRPDYAIIDGYHSAALLLVKTTTKYLGVLIAAEW